MSTYKTTKTIEITDPNQLRVDIYADDWQMAGSKKSKKKGEGASSKQKENSSHQKMHKILAQNATITQNSFDELMNEENVQTPDRQANKLKQVVIKQRVMVNQMITVLMNGHMKLHQRKKTHLKSHLMNKLSN